MAERGGTRRDVAERRNRNDESASSRRMKRSRTAGQLGSAVLGEQMVAAGLQRGFGTSRGGWGSRGRRLFDGKALAGDAIDAQHFNGRQRTGFEAHESAHVRKGRIPAHGKVPALEAIGATLGRDGHASNARAIATQGSNYCSSLRTVCVWLLA